ELAGNPKIKGTTRETDYLEKKDLWNSRIATAERQIVGLSLLLGEVLLRREQYKQAIPVFKEILTVKADHNTAFRRLGQTYVLLGDFNLAAMYLEKAHKGIMRRIFEIRDGLEGVGTTEPRPGEGEGEALAPPEPRNVQTRGQQIRALQQASIEIAAVIGVLCYLTSDFPKADDWFARAFEIDPTSYFLDLKLGLALLREGRKEKAGQHFGKFRKGFEGCEGVLIITLLDRIEMKDSKKS
ncbi:MAG: tetratricopeptide repeat protein, partial [Planctomycetota bacterium]